VARGIAVFVLDEIHHEPHRLFVIGLTCHDNAKNTLLARCFGTQAPQPTYSEAMRPPPPSTS
jgi:hypothetical protein